MTAPGRRLDPPADAAAPCDLAPPAAALCRVSRALRERRFEDAAEGLRRFVPTNSAERAWAALLHAELAIVRRELVEAEQHGWQAAVWAADALQELPASADLRGAERLWAMTLETTGLILRRRDRVAHAVALHERAYAAASRAGCPAQQCASAISLALCAEHAEDPRAALAWYEAALGHAAAMSGDADRRCAEIHTHLARRHSEDGNLSAARDAAQRALDLRLQADPTSIEAARARLLVGEILLNEAMALLESGTPDAHAALDQAAGRLGEAHDELAAFGPPARFDALWCRDQLDTARRLSASE